MKESKYKLGPNAIETTFKCNYATQKVLSTQGSEFDITALIFHLINPLTLMMLKAYLKKHPKN